VKDFLVTHTGILPTYTGEELSIATDGWASSNLLGEGGFGKVFIGKLRATTVAVKLFKEVRVLHVYLITV